MANITFSLVALDCPDPVRLADFYAQLTGWSVEPVDETTDGQADWVQLASHGQPTIAFQRVAHYVAPTWPEGAVPQQLHLDFDVDDLDDGERVVLGLGASAASYQPGETFRVFLDPVGHPFCLVRRHQD